MKLEQRYDSLIKKIPVEAKENLHTVVSVTYYTVLSALAVASAAVLAGYLIKGCIEGNEKPTPREAPSAIEYKVGER